MVDHGFTNGGNEVAAGQTRKRKRASEACAFCRRRKIKCTTERPECSNCKVHGQECHYVPIDETTRGNRRARDNGHSNADDGDDMETPSSTPRVTPRVASHDASVPEVSGAPDSTDRLTNVSRILVTANGVSSYHGRTSALYEENSHDRAVAEVHPRLPEDWVEKGLVAEAARQRQLEDINFRQGKLDFDGVEPELGMHLLSLHWNRQHHSFLITYRPAFMRDMACNGPYFSKLLLNAIYFGASKFSPRHEVRRQANDVRTAGWKFRERVRELLGGALDKSEITTIQALLVMTNSLFALGDERSAAWLYAGLAFRMIIDLGMHVDVQDFASTRKFSDEDLEIRRRVFWGAFVVDKIQSLYQGRPVSIKESDTLVPIKFLDTYEEFEHWVPFAYSTHSSGAHIGSPAYSISTFTSLCQLSVIMSDILGAIYTERSFDRSSAELSTLLKTLHSKLMNWHASLPLHLVVDICKTTSVPPPHVFSLHAMYNVLLILLHRPFVADGHLYNTSRSISLNSFNACSNAASVIVHLLRAYDKAFSVRRAPYLISYATYVAATIHARIAAKRGPASESHGSLESCLAVFRENQETNWAVRRANAIIQTLMKRLDVAIPNPDDPQIDRTIEPNRNQHVAGRLESSYPETSEPTTQSPSLDIDGIIQSFVREQEGPQQTKPVSVMQQQYPGGPHPMNGPYLNNSHLTAEGNGATNLAYSNGDWLASNGLHLSGDQPFSVDDLLYGFNGSALDSFPDTEWVAM